MEEKDLNRIIVSSLNLNGYGHKISDDAGSFVSTSKKPFDYIGAGKDFVVFGESKLIKGGYKSFNFNLLQDHQIEALSAFRKVASTIDDKKVLSVVSIGYWMPRKFFHVVFYDIDFILRLREKGKNSITKKDLDSLTNQHSCGIFKIEKEKIFDIGELPQRVVWNFD